MNEWVEKKQKPIPTFRVPNRMLRRHLKPLGLVAIVLLTACHTPDPYRGLEAGDLFALATKEFDAAKYESAQRALDRLFIAFPTYERAAEAQLMLAETYVRRKEYVTAQNEFTRFIDRFPTDPSAPDAALRRCQAAVALSPTVQRDQKYTEDAEVQCRNVASDYPGTPSATAAAQIADLMHLKLAEKLYTIGDYYYRRKFYESSITYYQMIEDDYSTTAWAPKALLGIMRAYQKIGYQDLVDETKQKILDTYPNSEEAKGLASAGGASAGAPTGDQK